jgi:glucose/arabinose dehydrogenase
VAEGLEAPLGMDLAPDGGLLVAEYGAGRLLHVSRDGVVQPLATGLRKPHSLSSVAGAVYAVEAGELGAATGTLRGRAPDGSMRQVVTHAG